MQAHPKPYTHPLSFQVVHGVIQVGNRVSTLSDEGSGGCTCLYSESTAQTLDDLQCPLQGQSYAVIRQAILGRGNSNSQAAVLNRNFDAEVCRIKKLGIRGRPRNLRDRRTVNSPDSQDRLFWGPHSQG